MFWEAVLDAELSGEIESPVLDGGLLCRFIIDLPDTVMAGTFTPEKRRHAARAFFQK